MMVDILNHRIQGGREMPTETLNNDTLLIEKPPGEVLGPLRGTVDGSKVILEARE